MLLNDRRLWYIVVGALALIAVDATTLAPAQTGSADTAAERSSEPAQKKPDTAIAVETAAADDKKIEQRLRDIYAKFDDLDRVTVEVDVGIVELGGEVDTLENRDHALRLASRVEGVVQVVDGTVLVSDVRRRLAPQANRFVEWVYATVGYLPLIVIGILVFLAFWLIVRWLGRFDYKNVAPNPFIANLVRQLVQGSVLLLGTLLALSVLDAFNVVEAVLGAAGLLGLGLSFALRETIENYIASLLLSIRQPFEPNDEVTIEGIDGHVLRLTSRATVLLTRDGNHVRIPNATVMKGVIVNYTQKPERRFLIYVGVDPDTDLLAAEKLAVDTLRDAEGILKDPAPNCRVEKLDENDIHLRIAGWVDQRKHHFRNTQAEARRLVKEAFDVADIKMEPTRRLRIDERTGTGLAEGEAELAAASMRPRRRMEATLYLARDTELDRLVERERALTAETDLLDPKAPKE